MEITESEAREKRLLRKREYRAANKERLSEQRAAHRKLNIEAYREKARDYYRRTTEEHKKRIAKWEIANPEKVAEKKRRWASQNKDFYAAYTARQKAANLRAMPPWADDFLIDEIYELSFLRTKATGIRHHVDHIVPLKSDLVCGLHWEFNLQVITASENASKRNRYWPDMPTEHKEPK